jgi:hypothetical protein
VPNCGVDGCEAAHHPLLHGALVEGRILVVQGIGDEKALVHLCREEDVRMEVAGKASHLHTLYDWGATVTLVTHAAAEKAGLKRVRQPNSAIAGMSGGCTMVNSYYMVPVVDGDDKVRSMKAMGMNPIATLATCQPTSRGGSRRPRASEEDWRGQQEMWRC